MTLRDSSRTVVVLSGERLDYIRYDWSARDTLAIGLWLVLRGLRDLLRGAPSGLTISRPEVTDG